ncbi:TonB-dependent Receptor Plug Domain [Sphingomonas laterariae]|uniref:TonB-dependent Receptor Plug Domain n=1 Tax=Edaphosphingomonas laterariae TaxID=861865 RepID=A0A239I2L6_9SPHN|nr:TonB-dependent receptor [Sphingomonas laterariae]SNS88096.1 TonB-dependent Receptor Plug Domain [Sphingomonas laterariae]
MQQATGFRGRVALSISTALALAIAAMPARAGERAAQAFDLPAQPLGAALAAVARQSGIELIAPSALLAGRTAPSLSGRYAPREALDALLVDSGLVIVERDGVYGLRPASAVSHEAESRGTIVVTGTRIRGGGAAGASVITIDRAELDRGGYATTQQMLQALPQNYGGGPSEATLGISLGNNATANTGFGTGVNLRGLGTSSTLVLLNGNRPPLGGFSGAFADVSMIPASMIERIEILADGASALYGSDAVAGVVNIIPRTRFEGLEVSLRAGTADGDFGEVQAGIIAGQKWASGRVVLAYEYFDRGRLAASQRDYATEDLRAFGGPDYRTSYANPGTIQSGGTTWAIPRGQDGRGLAPGDFTPDTVNKADAWAGEDLLGSQERQGLYGRVEQEWRDLTFYGEGLYADRRFATRARPISLQPRTVPVGNPFYVDPAGTGQPVRVQYDFRRDLGSEVAEGRVRAIGLDGGVLWTRGAWEVDMHGTFGEQKERSSLLNLVNNARLAQALADTDPATAYNLFGDGPSTNPATIEFVRGSSTTYQTYRLWSVGSRADGPLFDLPAGSVRLAVGGEYREERFAADGINDRSAPVPIALPIELPGQRDVLAGFAELAVPLFGSDNEQAGLRRLDLSLAGRVEHYSDFGTTANPKLGIGWTPIDGVSFRVSYGTSFRAPAFSDLDQSINSRIIFALPLADPASSTGSSNALVLRGNDPGIGPERATTWTAGTDIEPAFLPGAKLSLTWFHIRYRDRIVDPSSELFSMLPNRATYGALIDDSPSPAEVAGYFADPTYVDISGLRPDDIDLVIDARNQNLSVVKLEGLDFDLGYAAKLAGGDLGLGVSGSWLMRYDQAVTTEAPTADIVDTLGNPVDLRFRGRASWSKNGFGLAAFVNFVDGYSNQTASPAEQVDGWTTVDLQLSYQFPAQGRAGMTLAFSISNLFDADPPYVNNFNGISAVGFDPNAASPVGRMVAIQAKRSW